MKYRTLEQYISSKDPIVIINRDPIKYLNPSTDVIVSIDIVLKDTTIRTPEVQLGLFLTAATYLSPVMLGRHFQTGGCPTLMLSYTKGIILPYQLNIHLYDDQDTFNKLQSTLSQLLTKPDGSCCSFKIFDQTVVSLRFSNEFVSKIQVFTSLTLNK
jgi:hypothetical protein